MGGIETNDQIDQTESLATQAEHLSDENKDKVGERLAESENTPTTDDNLGTPEVEEATEEAERTTMMEGSLENYTSPTMNFTSLDLPYNENNPDKILNDEVLQTLNTELLDSIFVQGDQMIGFEDQGNGTLQKVVYARREEGSELFLTVPGKTMLGKKAATGISIQGVANSLRPQSSSEGRTRSDNAELAQARSDAIKQYFSNMGISDLITQHNPLIVLKSGEQPNPELNATQLSIDDINSERGYEQQPGVNIGVQLKEFTHHLAPDMGPEKNAISQRGLGIDPWYPGRGLGSLKAMITANGLPELDENTALHRFYEEGMKKIIIDSFNHVYAHPDDLPDGMTVFEKNGRPVIQYGDTKIALEPDNTYKILNPTVSPTGYIYRGGESLGESNLQTNLNINKEKSDDFWRVVKDIGIELGLKK